MGRNFWPTLYKISVENYKLYFDNNELRVCLFVRRNEDYSRVLSLDRKQRI